MDVPFLGCKAYASQKLLLNIVLRFVRNTILMPSSVKPTPEELETVVRLRSSLRGFAAATNEVVARHHLTTRQYDLCLLVASGDGRLIARQLAEALHLSPNTASELISRAEHEGLVTRAGSAHDSRSKPLSLTVEGGRRFLAAFDDLRPERARLLAILEESVHLASQLA